MRGLIMALFSFDFPGHAAEGNRARVHSATIPAKTTSKTTTAKTV